MTAAGVSGCARPPVVELDGVSVRFPRRATPVLQDVSLILEPGEQVIVFGPSGAGKSTLLQTLTGVIPHSVAAAMTGTVIIAGRDVAETEVVELSRQIGVMTQDPSSAVCLPDVEQELALPLENRAVDPTEISGRIDTALAAVNASALRLRRTAQLSGGEGQRVALAATLIARPQVLVLDEPTSMLDAEGVSSVRTALARAVREYGPAVILVEHRIDEFAGPEGLAGLPGRSIVLDEHGRILDDGPTPAVLARAAAALHRAGCWLPLEAELLAVFGKSGGLDSADVRAGLSGLAAAPAQSVVGYGPTPYGDVVLEAAGITVSRGAPRRWRRRRTFRRATTPEPNRRSAELPEANGRDSAPVRTIGPERLLRDVNLQVRSGEIVAVLGANGIGKTSLLLTLAGLLAPVAGEVRGPRPGMVFQNPEHQFVANTVHGEISHGLPAGSGPLVDELLVRHRLERLTAQNPYRLSGGEKRRLSVAAMLAHSRPALLADEPTFGLDRGATIAAIRAFRDAAARGRAIVFSSHDLRTVATLAHRAVVVAEGAVIADGPIFTVLRDQDTMARAKIAVPPLIRWLLEFYGSAAPESAVAIRRILDSLDGAVARTVGGERQL